MGNNIRTMILFKNADIYNRKAILVFIVKKGGAHMDITRISAISPVIRINGFNSKDSRTDTKSKEEKNGKEFEKTLKAKKAGEVRVDAYN